MPTFAELTGQDSPKDTDGISILPVLLNKEGQKKHDFFYFEFLEMNGKEGVIQGNWKLIHQEIRKNPTFELYNLASDPSENHHILSLYPEKAEELKKIMPSARTDDSNWPLF
jgi:Arylsulfatase A and related enzymes